MGQHHIPCACVADVIESRNTRTMSAKDCGMKEDLMLDAHKEENDSTKAQDEYGLLQIFLHY